MSEDVAYKAARGNESCEAPESASLRPVHALVDTSRSQDTLRRSGIPGVDNIGWGEHLCVLYKTKQELLKLVVPYIQAGLDDNEYCMWITGDPITDRDAVEALEAVFPQTHQCLVEKRLEILPHDHWYLSSGSFNEELILQNWMARARYAEANGFAGIRITGNPFWLQSGEDWAQFGCYERKIEAAIRSEHVLALCTYPTERCSDDHMMQIFSNHGSLLLNRNNQWNRLTLRSPTN